MMDDRSAPIVFGPGWRVPTAAGPVQVTLHPEPIGQWAQVDVAGRLRSITWISVDELGDAATATIEGLDRPVILEARRVVADFSSFVRGPRFRGAALRSVALGGLGLVLGIVVSVAWQLLDVPGGTFATVLAVGLTFTLASIPFRGTNAVRAEYRLLVDGRPLESVLVTQSGASTKVAVASGRSLADVSGVQPPAWPSDRAAAPVESVGSVGDGADRAPGESVGSVGDRADRAPGESVLAHLVSRKTDSGVLGVWSSELWLLPDGLLAVGTGLAGSVAQSMTPALPVVRRLAPADIDAMVAVPRSQRIPWTDVVSAWIGRGLVYSSLTVILRDGRERKFLWAKNTGNVQLLAEAAGAALGTRFEDRR